MKNPCDYFEWEYIQLNEYLEHSWFFHILQNNHAFLYINKSVQRLIKKNTSTLKKIKHLETKNNTNNINQNRLFIKNKQKNIFF